MRGQEREREERRERREKREEREKEFWSMRDQKKKKI